MLKIIKEIKKVNDPILAAVLQALKENNKEKLFKYIDQYPEILMANVPIEDNTTVFRLICDAPPNSQYDNTLLLELMNHLGNDATFLETITKLPEWQDTLGTALQKLVEEAIRKGHHLWLDLILTRVGKQRVDIENSLQIIYGVLSSQLPAIHYAAAQGHIEVFKVLLKHSISINHAIYSPTINALAYEECRSILGKTPLDFAKGELYEFLKKHGAISGAEVKERQNIREKIISLGVLKQGTLQKNHSEKKLEKMEIENTSANPHLFFSNEGAQPPAISLETYVQERNKITENLKSQLFQKTKSGETLLHLAASGGDKHSVLMLLACGADMEAKTIGGATPLHRAAMHGFTEIIKILIASGANVNALDKNRLTPLARAIKNNHSDAVEILIKNGANLPEAPYQNSNLQQ